MNALLAASSTTDCKEQPLLFQDLGLGKNSVLTERLRPALANAQARWCLSGAASVREFADLNTGLPRVGAGPAA